MNFRCFIVTEGISVSDFIKKKFTESHVARHQLVARQFETETPMCF